MFFITIFKKTQTTLPIKSIYQNIVETNYSFIKALNKQMRIMKFTISVMTSIIDSTTNR